MKALIIIICCVERCANWCSLFQKQFGKIPLQIYFHMFWPGGFFWVVLQEFILRTLLQNLPSTICLSEMSWSVVCRSQSLDTAPVSSLATGSTWSVDSHVGINPMWNFQKEVMAAPWFRRVHIVMLCICWTHKHFLWKEMQEMITSSHPKGEAVLGVDFSFYIFHQLSIVWNLSCASVTFNKNQIKTTTKAHGQSKTKQ